MKRYDIDGRIHENPNEGEWITYEDHKKILDAAMEVQKVLWEQKRELEHEVAELKRALQIGYS